LLAKQPDSFWESCKKNNIDIEITKYPISLDFEKIKLVAKSHEITLIYRDSTDKIVKSFNLLPMDIDGTQNIKDSFRLCFESNKDACVSLHNGRLYTCGKPNAAASFNAYFKTDLEESESDSIDIYKADGIDEILDFLRKPIPFCRYCNRRDVVTHIPWHTSKKDISEWTLIKR
jgi:DNA-directed RNA polymerase subunit N (RpoN/RPB10)